MIEELFEVAATRRRLAYLAANPREHQRAIASAVVECSGVASDMLKMLELMDSYAQAGQPVPSQLEESLNYCTRSVCARFMTLLGKEI